MEPTRSENSPPDIIRGISSAAFFFASKCNAKSTPLRANCGKRRGNESHAMTHRAPRALRAKRNHRCVLTSSRHRGSLECVHVPGPFKGSPVLSTHKVSFTQYDTSADIWNAGLLTRTSFQSQGFPEMWCHSSSKGMGNLLTRSSNNCITPSSLL